MKKTFLFLPFLALIACGPSSSKVDSGQSSIESNAEDFLKTTLKDPSSYEKISCLIIDSVKQSKSLTEDLDLMYPEEMVSLGLVTKAARDSFMNVITDLKNNPSKDFIAYLSIEAKYRAKNSFGALDIGHAIIYYFPKPPPSGKQFMIYSNK